MDRLSRSQHGLNPAPHRAKPAAMSNVLYDSLTSAGRPDAEVMEAPDGSRWTYAALHAATGRVANVLVEAGVRPDDRIAVQVEKSPMAFVLYLAAIRAGAVFLPLNTAYTPAEVGYFLGDAAPSLVVCDPSALDALGPLAPESTFLTLDADGRGALTDALSQGRDAFDTVARSTDNLGAIVYTSGTTGRSKGAMLSHGNLLSNARTLVEAWRFGAGDVLIHALPIYHVHGLFVAINTTLCAGASMIFLPRFDPEEVVGLMGRASVLMGVPTFYTRLLGCPSLTREAASSMRLFVSGSAPLLAETHRDFEARTGQAILERYGMTETGMNTSNPYDGARVPGTVGPPLPGVEVRITDPESGGELTPGEIGMIEVRGPNVFRGYWRLPEKTAAEFRPGGWFVTGDVGESDAAGYVCIVGRGRDLIITGGLNVYPKEVEAEIDALPGVKESAVVGLPHADFGEAVTAVVALKPGAEAEEGGILAALSGRLAKFKQPKRVIFVDELPRNAMAKVQKAALRERYRRLYE
jgi:malonyl-CoA/methylmalonyl-CoA synthetase